MIATGALTIATRTRTLAEFLLARIAEDEKLAHAALGCGAYAQNYPTEVVMRSASGAVLFEFDERRIREADPSTLALAEHFFSWQPAHVLNECKAKRAIVEREEKGLRDAWRRRSAEHMQTWETWASEWQALMAPTLCHLAAVYHSHPDYDPAWKVES